MTVRFVSVGSSVPSAEELRNSGARSGAGEASAESVARHLQQLLSTPKERAMDGVGEAKKPDKVYLVEGLPPLPRKTIERIQSGEFVKFANFPIFDGGRKEGEWSAERSTSEESSPNKQRGETKKKGLKEVTDVSWWGTCFTLYERARVEAKPALAKQLAAYREAIVERLDATSGNTWRGTTAASGWQRQANQTWSGTAWTRHSW